VVFTRFAFVSQYLPTGTDGNHEIICQDSQPPENVLNWDIGFLFYKYVFLCLYGNRKFRGLVSKLAPLSPIRSHFNRISIYFLFFERFVAKKVCTTCLKTSNKIVLISSLNKYLYNDRSEMKVTINVNNKSEKF
jgi:hypothetical protein